MQSFGNGIVDNRRYGAVLCGVLIVGGLLLLGGSISQDGEILPWRNTSMALISQKKIQ